MALEAKDVKNRLAYDPVNGVLSWKPKPVREGHHRRHDLAWNTRYAGKTTGYLNHHGYLVVNIGGRPHAAHRLAWAIVHGEWPSEFLDHKNTSRVDNRAVNLREASPAQNLMNKPVRKDSRSGLKGVQFHPQTGRWRARIKAGGIAKSLGLFATPEQAAAAYASAALAVFGEFAYAGAA